MIPDNVIYTDGHDVTITDTTFKVKKNVYKLNGITKHGMYILKPRKFPVVLLIVLGLVLAAIGFLSLLPATSAPAVETADGYIDANTVMIWVGVTLVIVGAVILALLKKRYAVRIDTAEGEKNALISTKRVYISQIVDALSQAVMRLSSRPEQNVVGRETRVTETEKISRQEGNFAKRTNKTEPLIYHSEKRKTDVHRQK